MYDFKYYIFNYKNILQYFLDVRIRFFATITTNMRVKNHNENKQVILLIRNFETSVSAGGSNFDQQA